jgi:3-oxoacyl-[acyl-carrier protein] reductase
MDLNGQRIFITGGSRGIGLAIAQELARHGAQLFLFARDPAALTAARDTIIRSGAKASCAVLDVSDLAAVEPIVHRAVEGMGGIDILVNNAAVTSQKMVVDQDMNQVEKEVRVNYLGTFAVTRAVLPAMLAQKRGSIINVSSTIGKVPGPTQANYCATKAAIIAFSSALRSEVEDQGIQVRVFIPGHTDTDMGKSVRLKTPRLMTAEEVARDFIRALNSRAPEYVCGSANLGIINMSRLFTEQARRIMKDISLRSYYAE